MKTKQMKSALNAELKANGFDHRVVKVMEVGTKTFVQMDGVITKKLSDHFNNRFKNGITTHEYFTFSINPPIGKYQYTVTTGSGITALTYRGIECGSRKEIIEKLKKDFGSNATIKLEEQSL